MAAGHHKIIYWQNLDKLDKIVQEILKQIPGHEYKMKSQINNAYDSAESNFVEGYYSGSTGEYLRFMRYSRRSVAELEMRVMRVSTKGFIKQELYLKFEDLIIKTGYIGDRLIGGLENKLALKK